MFTTPKLLKYFVWLTISVSLLILCWKDTHWAPLQLPKGENTIVLPKCQNAMKRANF